MNSTDAARPDPDDPQSAISGPDDAGSGRGTSGAGGTGSAPGAPGGSNASGGSTAVSGAVDDDAVLGANTHLYLNAQVPKLIIEVDALEGHAPTQTALSTLRSRIEAVADKPGGIQILPVETFSGARDRWTEQDLLAVEKRNRDRFSSRDAMVLYLLYLNGSFAEDDDALGLAYSSSASVVFIEQIREAAATPLVSSASIERAVLVHEVGHVLALVNIGYTSPRPHEDPQHPNHSNNANSVMYWAMDNVGVANLLGGQTSPPSDFDADDRADLADLKSGRLRVG